MIRKSKKPPVWRPKLDAERIGDRVKTAMLCKGMSVADLVRATGLRYCTVYPYVEGTRIPIPENLVALVVALNFPSVDHLLLGKARSQWDRLKEKGTGGQVLTSCRWRACPPAPLEVTECW